MWSFDLGVSEELPVKMSAAFSIKGGSNVGFWSLVPKQDNLVMVIYNVLAAVLSIAL